MWAESPGDPSPSLSTLRSEPSAALVTFVLILKELRACKPQSDYDYSVPHVEAEHESTEQRDPHYHKPAQSTNQQAGPPGLLRRHRGCGSWSCNGASRGGCNRPRGRTRTFHRCYGSAQDAPCPITSPKATSANPRITMYGAATTPPAPAAAIAVPITATPKKMRDHPAPHVGRVRIPSTTPKSPTIAPTITRGLTMCRD